MPHHEPPDKHRQFARDMRFDSTRAEEILWQHLRDRRIEGCKFRRQAPLKGFIVDFVCFDPKLVIEVDGGQHAENEKDIRRDAILKQDGFRVLRFWNDEVEKALDLAIRKIIEELRNTGE
jgi:very-short-patch-repair endonuclease